MRQPLTLVLSALLLTGLPARADESWDVDDADTLSFEKFHEDDEGGITVYDDETGELFGFDENDTQTVYEEDLGDNETASASDNNEAPSPNETRSVAFQAKQHAEALSHGEQFHGDKYRIRVRYTLGSSAKTDYTASSAVNNLHQQMARHCPRGWRKIREWTLPVEGDFYLHYLFQCAEPFEE